MKLRGIISALVAGALVATFSVNASAASSTASLAPIADCQIKDARIIKHQPNNVGFPHTEDIIPVIGKHKIIVIPIDFPDDPGTDAYLKHMNDQFKKYQGWFTYFSQGKASAEVVTSSKWFRAAKKSTDYVINKNNQALGQQAINDAMNSIAQAFIDTAGNAFDYTDVQGVFFYYPKDYHGGIANSVLGRGVDMKTPQGTKNLFWFGPGVYSYEYERKLKQPEAHWYGLWVHEILHSQGLAIHAPGNGFDIGVGQQQEGLSLVLDSWETFLLGWYNDDQVFCAPVSKLNSATIDLRPIETKGSGYKIAVLPLTATAALIVESRRPVGYSDGWQKNDKGLFVSILDTRYDNDRSGEAFGDNGNETKYSKWSYLLLPKGKYDDRNMNGRPTRYQSYLVKQGNSVTYAGVTIKLVKSGATDRVQITKR